MNFSSKLIEQAVEAFAAFPGIGRKTALRLVLHLINAPPEKTEAFVQAVGQMRQGIRSCSICYNISDEEVCSICSDKRRYSEQICLVESIRDLMAIEDTGQYRGRYHVLGGVISPIEGIGPEDLNIDGLVARIAKGEVEEVIMAISPTIEGDTTMYYLSRLLKEYPIRISTIARGVAFGGDLEYADELTLGRSIVARVPYKSS